MLPSNRAFFVRGDDGEEYGPVELEELRGWVRENRAGLGTAVRPDEANASWQPWQYYPELVALLAEAHATGFGPPIPMVAPMSRRMISWLIDFILWSILLLPIKSLMDAFMPVDQIIEMATSPRALQEMPPQALHQLWACEIIINACLLLYLTGFHAAHGKTPAKAIMRLTVVDQNGRKPSLFKSFLRSVALIFSINLFLIPLAYAFFNPQRRAFHDVVAGTYVIEA